MNEAIEDAIEELMFMSAGYIHSDKFEINHDGRAKAKAELVALIEKEIATYVSMTADASRECQALRENRWIDLNERKPTYDRCVLGRDKEGSIFPCIRTTQGFVTKFARYFFGATHWMPMPELDESSALNSAPKEL